MAGGRRPSFWAVFPHLSKSVFTRSAPRGSEEMWQWTSWSSWTVLCPVSLNDLTLCSTCLTIEQGCPNYGTEAKCSPRTNLNRPSLSKLKKYNDLSIINFCLSYIVVLKYICSNILHSSVNRPNFQRNSVN